MLDISLQNFETELITASLQQPVLLDIWAPWCGPCKALGPLLEKLETAYAGRFLLAKLNSDDQPEIAGQLSQMFGVRSIPFCVLFKDGQPVDGFVGALPEGQVREFLDKHVPAADEEAAELEPDAVDAEPVEPDAESALAMLRKAVDAHPEDDGARASYLRALLGGGHVDEARRAYEPVAARIVQDPQLTACGHWLAACEAAAAGPSTEQLEATLAANGKDFDARFALAQRHFAAQRFTRAMDELLEILMRKRDWNEGLARKTYIAILEVGAEPTAQQAQASSSSPTTLALTAGFVKSDATSVRDSYRRKLSMVLF